MTLGQVLKRSSRGVHGSDWVEGFFYPTQKFGLVGLVTQPNSKNFTTQPTQPSIFELSSGCSKKKNPKQQRNLL